MLMFVFDRDNTVPFSTFLGSIFLLTSLLKNQFDIVMEISSFQQIPEGRWIYLSSVSLCAESN